MIVKRKKTTGKNRKDNKKQRQDNNGKVFIIKNKKCTNAGIPPSLPSDTTSATVKRKG